MHRFRQFAAAAALSLLAFTAAQAQTLTRFVTGSSPGGGLDTLARALAETMAGPMKRTMIVESKPGASYNIAADFVAKSAPDGNTVLLTFNVHPIAGALYPSLPYDPVRDFRAVGMIATTPYVLVANPKLPGADLKEMIALAKSQNRSPTFASVGAGTPQHLMLERLKHQTGVDIQMIHSKSAAAALNDVMGGHVDFSLLTPGLSEPQVKAGKIKVLTVTSTSGSLGERSKSWLAKSRLVPHESTSPMTKPATASRLAFTSTSRIKLAEVEPRASRMPNSLVRWATR